MKNDREKVLPQVRRAVQGMATRTLYPEYPDNVALAATRLSASSLWDNLAAASGLPMTTVIEVLAFMKTEDAEHCYSDPDLYEIIGRGVGSVVLTINQELDHGDYDR